MIHSHRFAAANTAIPYVNGDAKQLNETEKFLQSGFITVDLFAATPIEESKKEVQMLNMPPMHADPCFYLRSGRRIRSVRRSHDSQY